MAQVHDVDDNVHMGAEVADQPLLDLRVSLPHDSLARIRRNASLGLVRLSQIISLVFEKF
jgi:hypothetical protein